MASVARFPAQGWPYLCPCLLPMTGLLALCYSFAWFEPPMTCHITLCLPAYFALLSIPTRHALQALRRLIVFGFQSDARTLEPVAVVSQTVPVLLQALQTLLAARPAKGAPRSQLAVMLDRGLIKLAKVITNVQEAHPWYDFTLWYDLCA